MQALHIMRTTHTPRTTHTSRTTHTLHIMRTLQILHTMHLAHLARQVPGLDMQLLNMQPRASYHDDFMHAMAMTGGDLED